MENKSNQVTIPGESIIRKIHWIRGEKVMLDSDLADLYGVSTKGLKQAVRRNIDRFPEDFMFELTPDETTNLRSQIVTSSWGGTRYQSFVFTEQGVAMLSGILNSQQAVLVNIAIMRAFVQLRKFLDSNKEMTRKMEELEKTVSGHDKKIRLIFEAIRQLIEKRLKKIRACFQVRTNTELIYKAFVSKRPKMLP